MDDIFSYCVLNKYGWIQEIGLPQNGWFIMENPIKMDDLGVPLFLEISIWMDLFAIWIHPIAISNVENDPSHHSFIDTEDGTKNRLLGCYDSNDLKKKSWWISDAAIDGCFLSCECVPLFDMGVCVCVFVLCCVCVCVYCVCVSLCLACLAYIIWLYTNIVVHLFSVWDINELMDLYF